MPDIVPPPLPTAQQTPPILDEGYLFHFRKRLMQDALTGAVAAYWRRRAAVFEAAKPRPTDYTGQATQAELRDQWRRLDSLAKACRARAECVPFDTFPEVEAALREAA